MNAQIAEEIRHGNEAIVRMRQIAARLRENPDASPMLNRDEYRDAVTRESQRCAAIDDTLALVELTFDRELTTAESRTLASGLYDIAENPGDLLGETAPGRYGMAFPWTTGEQVRAIAAAAHTIGRQAAPDTNLTVHYSVETTAFNDIPDLSRMKTAVTLKREDSHAHRQASAGRNNR